LPAQFVVPLMRRVQFHYGVTLDDPADATMQMWELLVEYGGTAEISGVIVDDPARTGVAGLPSLVSELREKVRIAEGGMKLLEIQREVFLESERVSERRLSQLAISTKMYSSVLSHLRVLLDRETSKQ
jgi:hypothetical protein